MAVAVPVEGPYEIHDFTVAANTAIPKNTLCIVSGSRTAAASQAAAPQGNFSAFAGIAATDKTTDDGDVSVELGLNTTGTFDIVNATTVVIVAGSFVALSGSNAVRIATAADFISGSVVGRCLEELPSAAAGEVKLGFP